MDVEKTLYEVVIAMTVANNAKNHHGLKETERRKLI